MDNYGLADFKFRSDSVNEDACGRWDCYVVVDCQLPSRQDAVGIDLGLKTTATCGDGESLESGRFYAGLGKSLEWASEQARNPA
ncbi:hypothetical protein [Pseudomonas putida]|uniref:Transposase n=1 Tax=Pseudomonas putida TaxID=303 RepID=A0A8I1ECV3_PSEPU|nr:hypothetical protein [Pseudomonas putida]MBI6882933.1 hypothetical protein [Pseudomonas putida]